MLMGPAFGPGQLFRVENGIFGNSNTRRLIVLNVPGS